jgi:hypothetical protein
MTKKHKTLMSLMFSILLASCSTENEDLSGSSLETENSIANAVVVTVVSEQDQPVARASVLVRPEDFLANASFRAFAETVYGDSSDSPVVESDEASGILNMQTDSLGRLILPKLPSGSYVLEARNASERGMLKTMIIETVEDSISLKLEKSGKLSGKVYLPEGVSSLTVGIRGLDYFVQTDAEGNFEFSSLPTGMLDVVGFVYSIYEMLGANGLPTSMGRFLSVGASSVGVLAGEHLEDVVIGGPLPLPPPVDTIPQDTVVEDTVEQYPWFVFETFEDSTYGWYSSVSEAAEAKLTASSAGLGREGLAAYFTYTNEEYNNWVLMGKAFEPVDFSEVDSVVFYARKGTSPDSQWVSFSFDVWRDSTSGLQNGKAWIHFPLDTVWNRYVVYPDSLVEVDSNYTGGNIGFDAIKANVTNLNFFGGGKGGPYEMWIDDISIYGIKEFE